MKEVREVVKGLKDRKAMEEGGIPNEVWSYRGEDVVVALWGLCSKVWKGEGWPEGWREAVMIPIVKKGEG